MNNLNIEVTERVYAQAMTPGDVMSARGYHSAELLFILDEANGIDADIMTAIKGTTASGHTTIIQLGNPTNNSGLFYDAFMGEDSSWYTMNISAFDSPNLLSLEVPDWFEELSEAPGEISVEDRKKLAYLGYLRRQWLRKRDQMPLEDIEEWGILNHMETPHLTKRIFVAEGEVDWARTNHPSWYGQVLGVFPDEATNQMFSRRAIMRADVETPYGPGEGPMVWGCDPAGMGQNEYGLSGVQIDSETFEHRQILLEGFQGDNSFEQSLRAMEPYMNQTWWINIDRSGAGERCAIELKRWAAQWGVPVVAFGAGDKSTNPLLFKNLKAQMYYHLRDLLNEGALLGVIDRKQKQQLLSIRFSLNGRGQVEMESKKDMERRGVESPDRAEALVYSCFNLQQFVPFAGYMATT